jgi:hypothetical protein
MSRNVGPGSMVRFIADDVRTSQLSYTPISGQTTRHGAFSFTACDNLNYSIRFLHAISNMIFHIRRTHAPGHLSTPHHAI